MTDSEFLISLAQNDYMIDQHMLPDGERLYRIANELERLQRELAELRCDNAVQDVVPFS